MSESNGNGNGHKGHAIDALLAKLPDVDLSAGILPDHMYLVPPDPLSEIVGATKQTVCIAHSDPSFSDQTWCGQPVGKTNHLSLDNTLYLLTGNISLPEFTNPQPCAECLKIVRSYLAPDPPFYANTGKRGSPPRELLERMGPESDFVTQVYAALSPDLANVLTVIFTAPLGPVSEWQEAFSAALKRLPSRFQCGGGGSEFRLGFGSDDLNVILAELEKSPEAEEIRKEYAAKGHSDPDGAFLRLDLASFFLLHTQFLTERIEPVANAALEAANEQAVIMARERLKYTTHKSQALANCITTFYRHVKEGVANPVGRRPVNGTAFLEEVRTAYHSQRGELATAGAFALALPSVREKLQTAPRGPQALKRAEARARSFANARIAACHKKGFTQAKTLLELLHILQRLEEI